MPSILYNLKNLVLRPGKIIQGYLERKTNNLLYPIIFYMLLIVFLILVQVIYENVSVYVILFRASMMASLTIGLTIGNYLVFLKKYSFLDSVIISLFISGQLVLVLVILFYMDALWFFIIQLLYSVWILIDLYQKRIGRVLAVLAITLVFLIAGSIFMINSEFTSKGGPEMRKMAQEEEQKRELIGESVEENDHLLEQIKNDRISRLDTAGKELIAKIDYLREELIAITGGRDENGEAIGYLAKSQVNKYILREGNLLDSVFYQMEIWKNELENCECNQVPGLVIIKKEDFKGKLMLEMVSILTDAQVQILKAEEECFLKFITE